MRKRPIISIVIPLYNTPKKFFRHCLEQISIQTFKNYEVIIVDDCSTEDYTDIFDEFNLKFNLIIYKLDKNLGTGAARQIGIDKMNGDFVTFIDADDSYHDEGYLAMMLEPFTKYKDLNITSSYVLEQYYDGHRQLSPPSNVWVFGKFFRKSFLDKYNIKFPNMRVNEDNAFCSLAFICAKKTVRVKEAQYEWNYNNESITRSTPNYHLTSIPDYVDAMIYTYRGAVANKMQKEDITIRHFNLVWFYLFFNFNAYLYHCTEDETNLLIEKIRTFYNEVYIYYESKTTEKNFKEWYFTQSKCCEKLITDSVQQISYSQFKEIAEGKDFSFKRLSQYHE